MILELEFKRLENGELAEATRSEWRPSPEEKEMRTKILEDFSVANDVRNKKYKEFNDRTLLEYQDDCQMAWNSYVPPRSLDPDNAWRSQTVRPITRNRLISIAAHVTGAIMFPKVFAQNENHEEDKAASSAMRGLMEWSGEQAKYPKTFLYTVIAMLVNPAGIIHTEFSNVMRKVKRMQEDGSFTTEEILDELYSGFQDSLVPVEELFIPEIYTHDIQKQPYLVRRRVLDWTSLQAKYGHLPNFKFVHPGLQTMFDEETGEFYEERDEEMSDRQGEEVIYYNRPLDVEIAVVNGVLMHDPERPNPRENKDYPFAKGGFELIDEGQFFYYKSAADKMRSDQDVADLLYSMVIDGTLLELMPPVGIFGVEDVDQQVVAPGATTAFQNPNTRMERITAGHNIQAGLGVLEKIESSMSESSQDPSRGGATAPGNQTAFEISRLEQNARVLLGLFGKMIGFMVHDFGILRMGDILQYLTVGDAAEISSTGAMLKYQRFLIEGTKSKKTQRIDFDLFEAASDDEILNSSFRVLDEEGIDSDVEIFKVNPALFRKMKFHVKIVPDLEILPSDAVQKALNLEAYDRAIQNPHADQEQVYRDFLLGSYPVSKDNPEKYIAKTPAVPEGTSPDQAKQDLISQITGGSRPGANALVQR